MTFLIFSLLLNQTEKNPDISLFQINLMITISEANDDLTLVYMCLQYKSFKNTVGKGTREP